MAMLLVLPSLMSVYTNTWIGIILFLNINNNQEYDQIPGKESFARIEPYSFATLNMSELTKREGRQKTLKKEQKGKVDKSSAIENLVFSSVSFW